MLSLNQWQRFQMHYIFEMAQSVSGKIVAWQLYPFYINLHNVVIIMSQMCELLAFDSYVLKVLHMTTEGSQHVSLGTILAKLPLF